MVVLGDVFAIVAILFGVCLSAWALVLGMALLFPSRASRAETVSENAPWKTFLVGLLVTLVGVTLSSGFLKSPEPGGKLIGFILLMAILSVAMLGLTGPAALIGQRMRPMEPDISKFRALARGAGLLVVAGLLPWVGWFVFAPLLLMFCTGAGLMALFQRKQPQPSFEFGKA